MSSASRTMSAYRVSSSNKPSSSYHHSAGDSGSDEQPHNAAALLGLNYPKEKTVINYDTDTAYILRSLSTLPPFPFPTLPSASPPQPSASSSALLRASSSLVLIPLSLEPPLPSYVPDTLIPAIYAHTAAYRSLLSSSDYAQARAELEAAEALLSHPEIWDEVVNGRPWKEALEADKKRRADWEESAVQREKAGACTQPQRPARLAVADTDAAMSSITEDAAEGAEGVSSADTAAGEQGATDSAAVSASASRRASSAQPVPPADIPQLQAATRLVWGCYLPLCWAELSRHEGKNDAALISSWRAWLAHDGFVQGEWKRRQEEKRAEERRQRGSSVADEEDEQEASGAGGKQAGALSAASSSFPSVHVMHPFTFPSSLSAAVLASLAVAAHRLHDHNAALLAFHAALTVLAATTPPASSSSSSYLTVDLSSLLNNIGCSLTRTSPPHPSLAFSYLTAAEESLAGRVASHHPRLESVRLNLSKLEAQRGGVAACSMRAMMDGTRDALKAKVAEAEAMRLSRAKKPAGKKQAEAAASSPPASGSAAKGAGLSGSGSGFAAIEDFGSDAAFFQQAKAGEEEKVAEAEDGQEALWLRGWKVELSEYEKLIVASLASGAEAGGGKAKKAAGGKKGKAKKS